MTSKRKAIVNGLVMTMAGGSLERGTVLIEGAQIVAAGTDVDLPADVDVIDAAGKVVMPGLIDAHSHVGLSAEGFGYDLADVNETSDPITPEVRALDALDPGSPAFEELLAAGVTTVLTGPGSANLIGGQWVCVKTVPRATVEDMVLLEPAGMKMALGENPKRVYGGRRKAPASRMGNAAVLRAALVDAQNYMLRWQRYEEEMARYQRKVEAGDQDAKKPTRPARDLKMEALVPVLKREMKARIHAHQANDILTAIRIAEEFDLDVTLEHVTEGYKIADLLAEKGLPVTVGPIFTGRKKYELRAKDHRNPGILANHGVKVAIQTDAASAVQYLAINAALAAREGMDETDALKAVTINAAEIIGVAERVGSLEVGKDADIVIFSGHPLEYRTVAEVVLVDGDVVYEREEA